VVGRKLEELGEDRATPHVLEALLRLRQAACHPGLVDTARVGEPSAKLAALLEQLEELRAEGHKALVFSQFTSLLRIVRRELESRNIQHEYLDGKTRDRAARVESFQNNPDTAVFLISLKAGGVGLNLTAADNVILLDPWWNPAAEDQAVDRTHRIGQKRPVTVYRLIALGTIEEKILALHAKKRALVAGIFDGKDVGAKLTAKELIALLQPPA
jgi:SNF2 family DNA or RNA helicase